MVVFEFVPPVELETAQKSRELYALTGRLNRPNSGNDLRHRRRSVIPRYAQRGREETLRRLTGWRLSAFGTRHLSCSGRPPASAGWKGQQGRASFQSALAPLFKNSNPNHICNFYQNIWQCEARTRSRLSTSLTIKKSTVSYSNQCRKCRKGQENRSAVCHNLTAGFESQQYWFAASYSVVDFCFFSVEHAKSSLGGGYLTVWYKRRSDGGIRNWRKPSFGVCTVWVQKQLNKNVLAQRSRIDSKMLDMYVQ